MQRKANPFTAGGALPQDAPSYVHRTADWQLLEALQVGKFCYLLDSRQVGKSSLLVRTADELRRKGIRVAWIDVSGLGALVTPEQWYAGMAFQLAEPLGLSSLAEYTWTKTEVLSPVLRWTKVVEAILGEADSEPLCVFIDEIDAVRTLSFSTDEFFASLRMLYQERNHKPVLKKLTVCLSGAASPSQLIDDVRTTPFNIGQRIDLSDFTFEEASPLSGLLPLPHLLKRVLYWTGGQPYLTQRLCSAVVTSSAKSIKDVDRECAERFLSRSARESEVHLAFAADRVRRGDSDLVPTLLLLKAAQSPLGAPFDPADPCAETLRLAGIVRLDRGRLRIRNRIIAQVFDRKWVAESLPDAEIRRQKQAQRRGFLRATVLYSVLGVLGSAAWWGMSRARSAERDALDSRTIAKKLDRRVQDLQGNISNLGIRQKRLSEENAAATRSLSQASAKNQQLQAEAKTLQEAKAVASRQAADAQRKANEQTVITQQAQKSATEAGKTLRKTESVLQSLQQRIAEVEAALKPDGVDTLAGLAAQWKNSPNSVSLSRALRATLLHGIQKRLRITLPFECYSAGYRKDGNELGIGGNDGNVAIFDAQTGRLLARGKAEQLEGRILPPEERRVNSLCYLPDGTLLTAHQDGQIRFWNRQGAVLYERKRLPLKRAGEPGTIGIVLAEPLPDGKYAAVSAPGSRVRLIRLSDGTLEDLPENLDGTVTCLAVREQVISGERIMVLAAGDQRGRLKLWDLDHKIVIRQSDIYRDMELGTSVENSNRIGLSGIRFGHDTLLLVGDRPSSMSYVTRNGDLHRRYFGALSYQFSGDVSSDDQLVAAGGSDGLLRIWFRGAVTLRPAPLYTVGSLPDTISEVRWRPGRREVVAVSLGRTAEVWTLTDGASFNSGGVTNTVTISPDGKWAATGSSDKQLYCWSLKGMPDSRASYGPEGVRAISFSHDGKSIAAGGGHGWIRVEAPTKLLDPPRLVLPRRTNGKGEGHASDKDILATSFSKDNTRLMTVDTTGTILTWDTKTWREKGRVETGLECITAEFSPDGESLALGVRTRLAARGEGEMRLFRFLGFTPYQSAQIPLPRFPTAVTFSKDASLVATGDGDGQVIIWDTATKKRKWSFLADERGVKSLAFAPNASNLAMGGESGEITLWELPKDGTSPERTRLVRYANAVSSLRFTPSGGELLAAVSDGSWRQIPVSAQEVWKRVQQVLAAR
ncbi:MAG: AAA-like domain-containing protein [Armatimonas sp.]